LPELLENDLKLKEIPLKEEDKDASLPEVPQFHSKLKLSEKDKARITEEIIDELDAIKDERKTAGLEDKWEELDNLYAGNMEDFEDRQFNLHKQTTKIKVDAVTRAAKQAFFDSDPIYKVTPRPEFERAGGSEVSDRQTDFLDYKLDTMVPLKKSLGPVLHSAVLKDGGLLKITYKIRDEKRKREELYVGDPKPALDQAGQPVVGPEGRPIIKNQGLEDFLKNYPEAPEKWPGTIKKLAEGKKVRLMVEYTDTTYNDPLPSFVDLKNFYVRLSVKGLDGLKSTKLTAERIQYNYWDLKAAEKENNFFDIDKLIMGDKNKPAKEGDKQRKGFEKETYELLECVFVTKIKGDDEHEIKSVFWINEEKKTMHGARIFPYFLLDSYYIPFFITNVADGFYQPGIGQFLRDSNIAEDAILNFILEGAYIQNCITPIVPEGSPLETQFLEKRLYHGVPLSAKPGEVDFLSNHMTKQNTNELLSLLQYLIQGDDDVSGVSQLFGGRESPLDPKAPAAKTLALLERSGLNVKEYIQELLPSFNEIAYVMLALYYQMAQEGVKYMVSPERVVGNDPKIFGLLTRSDMAAKTNIQANAIAFNFERHNEKVEDLALYQTIRPELLIARNPDAVYMLLKNLIKSWSKKWANLVDSILPPLEQFKQEQIQIAVQAVALFVKGTLEQSKATGLPPQYDPQALLQAVAQMIPSQVNAPPEEELKK